MAGLTVPLKDWCDIFGEGDRRVIRIGRGRFASLGKHLTLSEQCQGGERREWYHLIKLRCLRLVNGHRRTLQSPVRSVWEIGMRRSSPSSLASWVQRGGKTL